MTGTCLVDTTPPSVAFTSPDAGVVLNTATFAVSGTASDLQTGLAKVEISTDGATFSAAQLTGSTFTATLPVSATADRANLVVTARATDVAGLVATTTRTFLADRVGPTVTISTPAVDGACTASACTGARVSVASGATYNFQGTSTDPSGVASVSLRLLEGTAVMVGPVTVTPGAGGGWTWDWTSIPLVNGKTYVLEVSATDQVGNVGSTARRTVLVDRVPPVVTVTAPVAGAHVNTPRVTISGTVNDGASWGVGAVTIQVGAAAPQAVTVGAGGDFTLDVDVPVVDSVLQTIAVLATDLMGNEKMQTATYIADRVAPVVALTSPAADAVCPSATDACTGAVINAASGGQFSFQGSLSEGGGVASVTLTAEVWNPVTNQMVVRLSPAPTAAASWTGTWSGIGSYNGQGLSLRVFATDAAGNVSALATRGLWVDNVAPTVTLPVNGARLLSRTATLLTFSEPMQAASVRSALSFSPAVALPGSLGSDISGRSWGFTGNDLAPYTPYTLTGTGPVKDLAGNGVAVGGQQFLTAPTGWSGTSVLLASAGAAFAKPRLVVDTDGRPLATVQDGAGGIYAVRDPGSGVATVDSVFLPAGTVNAAGYQAWVSDLTVAGTSLAADGRLNVSTHMAIVYGTATPSRIVAYARQLENRNFAGAILGQKIDDLGTIPLPTTLAVAMPGFDITPAYTGGVPVAEALRVTMPTVVGTLQSEGYAPPWQASSLGAVTGLVEQNGAATLEVSGTTRTLRYWDGRGTSQVATCTFNSDCVHPVGVTQATAWGFGGSLTTRGPAFVAWASKAGVYGQVTAHVACSATPTAATPNWMAGVLNTVQIGGATSIPAAIKTSAARGSTLFAVAIESGNTISVVSTPANVGCTALPTVSLVGTITGGQDAAVAIDAAGKVWVAYIETATGSLLLRVF